MALRRLWSRPHDGSRGGEAAVTGTEEVVEPQPVADARDRAVLVLLLVWTTAIPAAAALLLWATNGHWVPWVKGTGAAAPWWMFSLCAVLGGASVLPSHAAALACGYTLGAGTGVAVAWGGLAVAALFGYAIARPLAAERAERLLRGHPQALAVQRALAGGGRWSRLGLVALLRLSPVVPFGFDNFLMAAARVPFVDFLVASWVGMSPRVVAVALAGAGAAEIAQADTSAPWSIGLGVAATLLAVWWLGRIVRRALRTHGVG